MKRLNKKEKILEAAKEIFAVKGFHPASMDEIAEAAGVAKGTLYNYFKDKEDLYAEVLLSIIIETNDMVKRAMASSSGLWVKLEKLIREALDYFSKNREVLFVLGNEAPAQKLIKSHTRLKELINSRVELLSEIFASHRYENSISKEFTDEEAAFLCLNLMEGVIRRMVEGRGKDPETSADLVIKFLRNGLGK